MAVADFANDPYSVLLPYDVDFLGVATTGLTGINPRLIPFLQHDRITLSGTMIALGILYAGLSWSEAAVDIQSNAAVSLTASAAQVRRPIYGTSSGRWRHYRAHLGPLVQALRKYGVALPDDA